MDIWVLPVFSVLSVNKTFFEQRVLWPKSENHEARWLPACLPHLIACWVRCSLYRESSLGSLCSCCVSGAAEVWNKEQQRLGGSLQCRPACAILCSDQITSALSVFQINSLFWLIPRCLLWATLGHEFCALGLCICFEAHASLWTQLLFLLPHKFAHSNYSSDFRQCWRTQNSDTAVGL